MIETVAQNKLTPGRIPLTADEPATLPEVYEGVARDYPKPDTLNYKRDGTWHSISAVDMFRSGLPLLPCETGAVI